MKGAIQPDHIKVNKYELIVLGLPPLVFTAISGIEDELQTTDLPDQTTASGGNKLPFEFTADLPAHHLVQQAAMEAWFIQGQDPISPTYKKIASLVLKSGSGLVFRSFTLMGVYVSKRGTPDLEMENEGELAVITWTLKGDDMFPI